MPLLRYGNSKIDNVITLKTIFLTFFLVGLTLFFLSAFPLRQRVRSCNLRYQDAVHTTVVQSQAVLYDHSASCLSSYELLTDWDLCLSAAEAKVPEKLRTIVSPIVSSFMKLSREKENDMNIFKIEHDERCKDTELLFYPPESE